MNRGESEVRAARALSTNGSSAEEDLIRRERARSRALMTTGSGRMGVSTLSVVVSRWSFRDRASAGPIRAPGVTVQAMSKS